MTTIAVVTPWFNHPELAHDYLHAVSGRMPDDELIVIDNASDPPVPFATHRADRNHGFAAASNLGLHRASREAVLFLNNDVACRDPGWLNDLRRQLEPGVLVGARLRYDRHGDVDGHQLPYLDGWCLAGMRDDLLALGGFDEDYEEPAYYSDNDLCLRARLAGMRLREARVGVIHKVGITTGPHSQPHVALAVDANHKRYAAKARAALEKVAA